ncbi:RimK family alpha-L-glutamate ligase [bacterium]|nr:RimK family alpha-L-glutamate ligase [bacterium]
MNDSGERKGSPLAIILSRNPYLYTVRRLVGAARSMEWNADVVDPFLASVGIGAASHRLVVGGKQPKPDVVINRLSSLSCEYSVQVLAEFERGGALTINPAHPTFEFRHKFSALCALESAGIPIPETRLVRSGQNLNRAILELGGPPVVLKYLRGTQGIGVIWCESFDAAASITESLNLIQYDVMLQRHYRGAKELDLRVLVLGGKAIAAVNRVSGGSDFRSNFHRGGKLYKYDLSDDIAGLAVKAASVLGLNFAGVDIILGDEGPIVLEVNLSPGFEGMDKAHGCDIARHVLEWAKDKIGG